MSSASKSKSGKSLEIEVGKEKTVRLKPEPVGRGRSGHPVTEKRIKTYAKGTYEPVKTTVDEGPAGISNDELPKLLQALNLSMNLRGNAAGGRSDLEVTPAQSSSEAKKRLARKAAWRMETQKEMDRRAVQRRTMESLPKERVKAVKGKAAMSKMFTSWRDKLKYQRTSFLFHAVFPILHEEGYLATDDILNSRLTSREWKNSVEQHLQSWLKFSELSVGGPQPSLPVLQIYFQGSAAEEVKLFNAILSAVYTGPNRNLNPFISRKLAVQLTPEFMSVGLPHMFQILKRWGREIWQLVIVLNELDGFNICYEEICYILRLTPNLRAFCVHIEASIERPKPYTMSDSKLQEVLVEWRLRLKQTPLPGLPNLSLLSFSSPLLPMVVVHAMLSMYGATLTTVEVGGFDRKLSNFIIATRLPQLRELSYFSYHVPRKSESLASLSLTWPALEKIKVFHYCDRTVKPEDVQNLFDSLTEFGENLRHLTFALLNKTGPFAKMDVGAIKRLCMKLPQLERLDLVVCNVNLDYIDFILPLKSLKKLDLCYFKYVSSFDPRQRYDDDDKPVPCKSGNPEEIIHFSKYVIQLYESNIWELFPELKDVTIKVVTGIRATNEMKSTQKHYTRDGYRRHHNLL